jgi:hypothetical protein
VPYIGALLVSSSGPSYLTRNRLGVDILQIRVPVHIRQARPGIKSLIQRSLHTRNRREALSLARKMVVCMEDNDFDLERYDREAERDAELFHIGRPLFEELNCLWAEGDTVAVDAFLVHLTLTEDEALRYLAELNNRNVDYFEQLLNSGDRQKTAEFLMDLPRVFKKPLRDVLNRHRATFKAPQQQPVRSTRDIPLDVAFDAWKDTYKSSMAASSFEEYCRRIALFLRIIKHINHGTIPHVYELTTDMIGEYKKLYSQIPKSVRTKDKTIEELIKLKGDRQAPSTV